MDDGERIVLEKFSGGGTYPPAQIEAANVAVDGEEWRNVPFASEEISLREHGEATFKILNLFLRDVILFASSFYYTLIRMHKL